MVCIVEYEISQSISRESQEECIWWLFVVYIRVFGRL